jgi:nucleotide-binding universal stress UspA family protein
VLFIPIFFVDLGLLINLPIFIKSIISITVPLTIVIALIGSKGIAAYLAKLIYRYNNQEFLTMWSLSLPQVGATLAATLVGYRVGMLTEEILNSVIVLMLVTSTLGPLMTSKFAVGLTSFSKKLAIKTFSKNWGNVDNEIPLTVLVPVYNPDTERYLIEMAALLVHGNNGHIIPLAITPPHTNNMDAPQLEVALQRSEILLENATKLAKEIDVDAQPMLRIDDDIPQSIVRVARENKANLIVMGWGKKTGLRARLFGNIIDSVLWTAHCPVAVTRLLKEPSKIQRVLVPVENLNSEAIRLIQFAQILGDAELEITVLHLYDRGIKDAGIAGIDSQLSYLVAESKVEGRAKVQIEVRQGIDVVKDILRASNSVDLVVLRSTRNRTSAGLAVSDVTTQLLGQLNCSIVMLGEPHH